MHKLIISLLIVGLTSCSSPNYSQQEGNKSLDMNTLQCRNLAIDSVTTLKDVQDNCVIKKAMSSNGRYEVKFVNSYTDDVVTCYFASNTPNSLVNSCH